MTSEHFYDEPLSADKLREIQEIFAQPGESFVSIVLVDPAGTSFDTLEHARAVFERTFPDLDLRFSADFVVHVEGVIFDGMNYARYENISGGCAYAVYSRQKDSPLERWEPRESRKRLMRLIKAGKEYPVITGDEGWERCIGYAVELFGEKWREKIFPTSD